MTIEENDSAVESVHGSERQKPSYDDINTPAIVMVAMISAVITYAIVVLVQGMTYHMEFNMIKERSYGQQHLASVKAIDEQKANLQANDKGRISIEEAMQDTLKQLAKKDN